jgi:hypothetical protein
MYTLIEYAACLLIIIAFGALFFGLSVLLIVGRQVVLSLAATVRKIATRSLAEPKVQVRHAFQPLGADDRLHE